MELSSTESHEKRAATFMLQLHLGRGVGLVQTDGESSVEQDSTSRLTDEDLWIFSAQLLHHFERLGDVANLQRAITLFGELVRATSVWDDRFCGGLAYLGVALWYQSTASLVSKLRPRGHSTPRGGHPEKPAHLSNLGNSFLARFERLGEVSDLDDAISRLSDAVDLTPHGHSRKPVRLNNLGDSLRTRFKRLGELSDLEHAVSTLRGAGDLTPRGHPHKPGHLNNLGNSIFTRFECLGELRDLEDAISTLRDAVDLTPHGHPDNLIDHSFRASRRAK